MQFKVLKYLINARGRVVKARDISEMLCLPMNDIAKTIVVLKDKGYQIDGDENDEVTIKKLTDVLDANSIKLFLEYNDLKPKVVFSTETSSTNTDAKILAQSQFEGIVATDKQFAGKGRRGRVFKSEPGGIYFSYVKRPQNMFASDILKVVLQVGVAICDTLTDYGLNAKIKWPNDVYVCGKKICGILCEMITEDGFATSVIMGVGVNVNNKSLDNSIKDIATSMFLEKGQEFLRAEVLANIIKNIEQYSVENENFDVVLEKYREYSNTIGKDIFVISDDEKYQAKAIDVDENGFLIVKTEQGNKIVISADVSIRGDF